MKIKAVIEIDVVVEKGVKGILLNKYTEKAITDSLLTGSWGIKSVSVFDIEPINNEKDKYVLCPVCKEKIHIDDFGAIKKTKNGEIGFYHGDCYLKEIEDEKRN